MYVTGMSETLAAIQKELEARARVAKNAVRLAGNEYKTDVQKIAPYRHDNSGIPGGTYRRSIHVQMIEEGGNPFALVGTDLPYGKRLEFGFWDMTDSIGRHFYQKAQPHFRPALDLNMNKYYRIMKGTFDRNSTEILVEGAY